jgi:cyclase
MKFTAPLLFAAATLITSPAIAQSDLSEVEIKAEEVAPGIAVLFGAGGNIGVSYGDGGTILIDDQFAPLTEKIEAAVADLGATPVKFLVNTHWHFDHTGGNENFGKRGALIFAHDNVRARMLNGGTVAGTATPPAPAEALPIVTYGQGLSFHVNGDTVDVIFLGGGHTDGDSIIRWRESNVVHMGDLYFNIPGYPFIDTSSGGNTVNAMNSLDSALRLMDNETKVIPGHGPMSNKAELVAYRVMIGQAVTNVRVLKDSGKTLEETVAAKPLAGFNRGEGFIGPDAFVTAIYNSL